MAVPKKKTSKSKRNMRRSHDALSRINVIIDKDTGEYRLPHHMDKSSGEYNKKQIVDIKLDEPDAAE
ncbi:MAG: 50S ribosomal protein L32 [Rickettsiaceae bacterium]